MRTDEIDILAKKGTTGDGQSPKGSGTGDILELAEDLARNPIHCPETDEVFRRAIAKARELSDQNEDLMAHCNDLRTRCWNAEQEALRWQKEAVERLAMLRCCLMNDIFDEMLDTWKHDVPAKRKEKYRDQARKELGISEAGGMLRPESHRYLDLQYQLDSYVTENEDLKAKLEKSIELTQEQRAALEAMANLRTEITCPECGAWVGFDDIKPYMQVLRDMLEGKP